MIRISVILPVYNGERYLSGALDSILGQTCRDFELIIVDDGSTDGTNRIVQMYSDPRIILVRNSQNLGLIYSLNKGLMHAKGQYLARHDVDDISFPKRFALQASFLDRHPNVVVVGTDYFQTDVDQGITKRIYMPKSDLEIKWHGLFQSPIAHATVMFRTAEIRELGGYSSQPNALFVEDYDLWSRLIWSRKKFANLNKFLVQVQCDPNGVSRSNAQRQYFNFSALARQNMRLLGVEDLMDARCCDLLWSLQVGGGITASLTEIWKALVILDQMVNGFGDSFELNVKARKYIRKTAFSRAANTILKNATFCSYESRRTEAKAFAKLAIGLHPKLILVPSVWKLFLKGILNVNLIAKIRQIRNLLRDKL